MRQATCKSTIRLLLPIILVLQHRTMHSRAYAGVGAIGRPQSCDIGFSHSMTLIVRVCSTFIYVSG
jgi:hypothetical protein